jgi:hypothetical protein
MKQSDLIKTMDVRQCARCGMDHQRLPFRKLGNPNDQFTHWATCPGTGEPIMMRQVSINRVQEHCAQIVDGMRDHEYGGVDDTAERAALFEAAAKIREANLGALKA